MKLSLLHYTKAVGYWLLLFIILATFFRILESREVPFYIRSLDSIGIGQINENFRSVTLDLKRIEENSLLQSNTCEVDTPRRLGVLCFDKTDFKLYVATSAAVRGFMTVGSQ